MAGQTALLETIIEQNKVIMAAQGDIKEDIAVIKDTQDRHDKSLYGEGKDSPGLCTAIIIHEKDIEALAKLHDECKEEKKEKKVDIKYIIVVIIAVFPNIISFFKGVL